jgi:glycosyltransferase involved in cell wall biosynthesis
VENLDLVFYQSQELHVLVGRLLETDSNQLSTDRHVVLPRGIPPPPPLTRSKVRQRVRTKLGIGAKEVLVLSVGRLTREKGIYELLQSSAIALANNPSLTFRIIGAVPSFDETRRVQGEIESMGKGNKIALLPACAPKDVWKYLCAADIFAFPSHHEGMPNSLLEAMIMGVPSIAFAIPPVLEIDAGTGALVTVPVLDTKQFAAAIIELAGSPRQRLALGRRATRRVQERFLIRDNMREAMARLSSLIQLRSFPQASAVSNLAPSPLPTEVSS